MNKIALWKTVCVDDWTAERAIIASNGYSLHSGDTAMGYTTKEM